MKIAIEILRCAGDGRLRARSIKKEAEGEMAGKGFAEFQEGKGLSLSERNAPVHRIGKLPK